MDSVFADLWALEKPRIWIFVWNGLNFNMEILHTHKDTYTHEVKEPPSGPDSRMTVCYQQS